jgi:hypothetical protein
LLGKSQAEISVDDMSVFAAHPPFQIDANLGYVAAIAECFVQSHDGRIALLRRSRNTSLPEASPAWSRGPAFRST